MLNYARQITGKNKNGEEVEEEYLQDLPVYNHFRSCGGMEALKCQIIDSATDRQTLDLLENHYMTKLKTLGEGRLNLKLNAVPPAAVDQFLVDGKIGLTELTNPHLFKHLVTGAGSSPDGGATGQEDEVEKLRAKIEKLEKKLNDAYEEVEDQRQVVAQWKSQLETQVGRLKETIERLNKEVDDIRIREQSRQDQQKKMGRQLRDLKEDYATLQGKESDLVQKNGDLEKQIEVSDVEVMTLKSDLKLAMKRIEDLQVAISGDIEDDA